MSKDGIAIVDINYKTAPKTWHLLMTALDKADYVALDLELSGLGTTKARGVDERYEELCEVVNTRAIVSVGVATFKHNKDNMESATEQSKLKIIGSNMKSLKVKHAVDRVSEVTPPTVEVQVFNVWLLCGCPYTIDPSSAKFLVSHGFDFNKQFSLGLQYMPPSARDKMYQLPKYSLDEVMRKILEKKVPVVLHNGQLDLLHLYHACLGPLPHALPTLLADLAELFVGGVYDTKAIAQFKFYEDATFLEYLFRKSQRWSGVWLDEVCEKDTERQLRLCYPTYSSSDGVATEMEDVAPPPRLPQDQLLQVQICSTYASGGYCNAYKCEKSHNVTLAIDQKNYFEHTNKSHRKRKRPKEYDVEDESHDSHKTTTLAADQENTTSLVREFETAIAAARQRLSRESKDTLDLATATSTTPTSPAAVTSTSPASSCSHRSGVDAFMTGFTFTCYVIQAQHDGCHTNTAECRTDVDLSCLKDTKNCLASRRYGQHHLPLTIFKSQYAKNSSTFIKNKERLLTVTTELNLTNGTK